ncbi:pyridoxamine 5'-phosphate oxidase [Parvularcula lutaonensis]|uniref:Pyridoxine/pyridoxamine 5'-phosphate oxidase n=1 Tax=Parvularcula lutaonensis TaxID=491923 RepID=A0ABV7MET8_9PROT|nr:pyridoxamine 5'-phosphate oxidase [Parvularcula lutaonensis]GGY54299.1 pyridoxine/pyridoxamine 5'-phosphate oxidase [Parvularcula lutaonensis]
MSESDDKPEAEAGTEALIPDTPTAEDYAKEAKAQEAFSVDADQGDVFGDHEEPLALFKEWLALAKEHEINDPNAMAVSSVDAEGKPDSRMVLLKELDHGFTFYTNLASAKGEQLQRNPNCALLFHWKSIRRQVRIRGRAEVISDELADAYFARRDRGARIGAWASQQSRPMSGPDILETRVADYEALFEGKDVPRPDWWKGFRVIPETVEFWVNRPFRLHDRKLFRQTDDGWETEQLYP